MIEESQTARLMSELIQATQANDKLTRIIENMRPVDLRDQFAMNAPADEIKDIVPQTCGDICRFLGLDVDLNANRNTYPDDALLQATVKARYLWADAMLKARNKEQP